MDGDTDMERWGYLATNQQIVRSQFRTNSRTEDFAKLRDELCGTHVDAERESLIDECATNILLGVSVPNLP